MKTYAKAIAQVLAAIGAALVAALADDTVSTVEWLNTLVIGLGAVLVWIVPNLDAGVARYSKGFIAAATAAIVLAIDLLDGGISSAEWIQLGLAAAGAVGVGALNGPKHLLNPRPLHRGPAGGVVA